jgi:hypothetical protein
MSWQNVRRDTRAKIKIDGEAVVELDFSTLHPAMLYAEVGSTMPIDCYAIGVWPRNLVKLAVLVLINARTQHKARSVIANEPAMASIAPQGSQAAFRAAQRLIDDIKAVHKPIAYAFHSDAGARLMRLDSDLAEYVMLSLARQGITALPIHDSFLVRAADRGKLEAAMRTAADAIGLNQIRIKQSA